MKRDLSKDHGMGWCRTLGLRCCGSMSFLGVGTTAEERIKIIGGQGVTTINLINSVHLDICKIIWMGTHQICLLIDTHQTGWVATTSLDRLVFTFFSPQQ